MRPYISWPTGFDIDPNKITGYLLNPHGRSPGKARWWIARGFSATRPDDLMDALYEHTSALNFAGISIPQPRWWGHSLLFEGPVSSPSGETPRVRTVWQVDYGTPAGLAGVARMMTAHRI